MCPRVDATNRGRGRHLLPSLGDADVADDTPEPTKTCSRCGEDKPEAAYVRDPVHSDGLASACRDCVNRRRRERRAKERALRPTKTERRCPRCGLSRPIESYAPSSSRPSGSAYCRECRRRYGRERRARNPELAREKERAQQKAARLADPERVRERKRRWVRTNREKVAAQRKAWRQKNRESYERELARAREWRSSNADRMKEYLTRWLVEHPEAMSEHSAKRRAAKYGVGYQRVDFRLICKRDNWTCQLCGEPVDRTLKYPDPLSKSRDHIVPLARGGIHAPHNVQLAHLRCNVKKHDRLDE